MKYKYFLIDKPHFHSDTLYFWFANNTDEHPKWGDYYRITSTLGKLHVLTLMRSRKPGIDGQIRYKYSDLLG